MKRQAQYCYRNAHTIVSEITLLELGHTGDLQDLTNTDHFRFTVTGTNTDTGIRQQFHMALLSKLTPSQRGGLDRPYIYRLVEETVAAVLASYGYFITGNAPRGLQFERGFERFILAPGSIAAALSDGTCVVFEGKSSVFDVTPETLEGDDFKDRTDKRPYLVASSKKVYPYLAEDIPKWGQDDITVSKAKDLFDPRVEEAVKEHYQTSHALPSDRCFPTALLTVRPDIGPKAVSVINSPDNDKIVVRQRQPIKPGTKPISRIDKAALPKDRLTDEDMALWQRGVQENDAAMRSPHPVRTPWRPSRATG